MHDLLRISLQVIAYFVFAIAIGYFSFWPRYQYASAEQAAIKVSLSHAAGRVKPCVILTPEEIARLAPNMRRTETCERERLPVTLQLEIDGEVVALVEAPASGLWNDGPASIYERFVVASGPHRITAKLRDTARVDGWDYTLSDDVLLQAGRYFTITFRAENGGFNFR